MVELKVQLISRVTKEQHERLTALKRAADETHANSTSEESKAEGKYDTRGLEASYLAEAQAEQVSLLEDAVKKLDTLDPEDEPDNVLAGSLVVVSSDEAELNYLILPAGGGMEFHENDESILVLSPTSPIGQILLGKEIGDTVDIPNHSSCYISEIY